MSVWQSAFATTFKRTSPALGAATTMSVGLRSSTPKATAALHEIGSPVPVAQRRPGSVSGILDAWRRWVLAALESALRGGARARLRAKTVDVRRGRSISISLAAILRASTTFTRRGRNHGF